MPTNGNRSPLKIHFDMKVKLFKYSKIGYPVGNYPANAIKYAKGAAKQFISIKEYEGLKVNVWCRGSSGAILSALFISCMPKPSLFKIIHIKKIGEKSHADSNLIFLPSKSNKVILNIIIDDFCETGETVRIIHKKLLKDNGNDTPVACFIINCMGGWEEQNVMELVGFVPAILITTSPYRDSWYFSWTNID